MLTLRKQVFSMLKFGAKFIFLVPITYTEGDYYVVLHKKKILIGKKMDESNEDLPTVIAHAILSFVLYHDKRHEGIITSEQDHDLWNLASEIVRTDCMRRLVPEYQSNIFMGPEVVGISGDLSVEQVFDFLKKEEEKFRELLQKHPTLINFFGQGEEIDGAEGAPSQGEGETLAEQLGIELDGSEMQDVQMQAALEEALKMAIEGAKRSMLGHLTDFRKTLDRLEPRRNPFKDLIQFVGSKLGSSEYRRLTINRPNRRYKGLSTKEVITPAYYPTAYDRIAVIVDVSGSVHSFINEIANALYSLASQFKNCLDVFFSDIDVIEEQENFDESAFKEIPMGGGTDLGPIVERLDGKYQSIIMITDGETSWPKPGLSKVYCWLIREKGYGSVQVPDHITVFVYGK